MSQRRQPSVVTEIVIGVIIVLAFFAGIYTGNKGVTFPIF